MTELYLMKSDDLIIRLVIARTTIPSKALPANLALPAHAQVTFHEKGICINVQMIGHECDFWQTSEETGELHPIRIGKDDLLRVVKNVPWSSSEGLIDSAAVLEIRDPLGVEESLQIHLASLDSNNPDYWIKLLAKMLNERLGVPIKHAEKVGQPPGADEDDNIPF